MDPQNVGLLFFGFFILFYAIYGILLLHLIFYQRWSIILQFFQENTIIKNTITKSWNKIYYILYIIMAMVGCTTLIK